MRMYRVAQMYVFFFFQAEDGIRDYKVTGVQTCALPICSAAYGTAPEGSTMIFMTSHSWRIARTIASSDTVVMSSTRRWISANGRSPSALRRPSAMVTGLRLGRVRPAPDERAASSAAAGPAPLPPGGGLGGFAP